MTTATPQQQHDPPLALPPATIAAQVQAAIDAGYRDREAGTYRPDAYQSAALTYAYERGWRAAEVRR